MFDYFRRLTSELLVPLERRQPEALLRVEGPVVVAEPGHEAADVLHVLDGVGAAGREVRERRVEQLSDDHLRARHLDRVVPLLEDARERLLDLTQENVIERRLPTFFLYSSLVVIIKENIYSLVNLYIIITTI